MLRRYQRQALRSLRDVQQAGVLRGDGSRFYVSQLYWDFFNHAPDQDGLNYWRSNITQCGFDTSCIGGSDPLPGGKRVDVARAFFTRQILLECIQSLAANEEPTITIGRLFTGATGHFFGGRLTVRRIITGTALTTGWESWIVQIRTQEITNTIK